MTSAHVCDELNTFMNDLKFKRFSIELQNIILKRQGLFDKSDLFNFYFIDKLYLGVKDPTIPCNK